VAVTLATNLELVPCVVARVRVGEFLGSFPRWEVAANHVTVPSPSTANKKLVGSFPWASDALDKVLFDKKTTKLQSLALCIPDESLPSSEPIERWSQIPGGIGTLELITPGDFSLEWGAVRWVDHAAEKLVVLYHEELATVPPDFKLEVTKGLWLLFASGRLLGWALLDPARYLVAVGDAPEASDPSPRLRQMVATFFNLTSAANIDRMYDRDAGLKRHLDMLVAEARAANDKRSKALAARLDELLDTFYGES
jgi:hypothetical protein